VLPAEGASQVFVSLVVSVGMMVLLANTRPYANFSDDVLAQFCQTSLTFSLAVGLLEIASVEFQDALFGPLLVTCTFLNLLVGFGTITVEFAMAAFPDTVEEWMVQFQTSRAVARVKKRLRIVENIHSKKNFTKRKGSRQSNSVRPLPETDVGADRSEDLAKQFETRRPTFTRGIESAENEDRRAVQNSNAVTKIEL